MDTISWIIFYSRSDKKNFNHIYQNFSNIWSKINFFDRRWSFKIILFWGSWVIEEFKRKFGTTIPKWFIVGESIKTRSWILLYFGYFYGNEKFFVLDKYFKSSSSIKSVILLWNFLSTLERFSPLKSFLCTYAVNQKEWRNFLIILQYEDG